MKDLLPLEAYLEEADRTLRGVGPRLGLVCGVVMGVSMTVITRNYFGGRLAGMSFGWAIATVVATMMVLGFVAGYLWGHWMRWVTRRYTKRFYENDPEFVALPERLEDWEWRVLGNVLPTDNLQVPGALYLGHEGVLFVPHRKVFKRYREPIRLGPVDHLVFRLAECHPNALLRAIRLGRAEPIVEISSLDRATRFMLSRPAELLPRLASAAAALAGR